MDDDLNVAAALAVVHDAVRRGNAALDDGDDVQAHAALADVLTTTDVLGVNPLAPQWVAGADTDEALTAALDVLVQAQLAERAQARVAKDWAAADAVRDRLKTAGIVVADGKDGSTWTLEGSN